jgi:hypothetical protein
MAVLLEWTNDIKPPFFRFLEIKFQAELDLACTVDLRVGDCPGSYRHIANLLGVGMW